MSKIFALDIGTRKVAGLIAQPENGVLRITDCEVREHQTRAMLAGQIHDVEKVAEVIGEIKQALESRLGEKLEKAAVAVAGRALKTLRGTAIKTLAFENEITAAEVLDLELAAVQQVLGGLNNAQGQDLSTDYYCVGYSVVNYYLDNEKMDNLVSQKAREIKVDIIATFLPRVVLESMFTVLKKVGLEVSALTLEPIAAINAIIPQDMRRLNLALVDIGAGTSDIAITSGGSVVAYGMVPHAGDEITEKLAELYLLDFYVGERVKKLLTTQAQAEFSDIFGKNWNLSTLQVLTDLSPAITDLAAKIVDEIMVLNKTRPSAVVCVGGGSLTPLLQEKIAQQIGLARERVGIRGPELIRGISNDTGQLTGPEAITPLGIVTVAAEQQGLQFVNVMVNGKRIHLLNINQKLNVLSALVASGIGTKKMHSRPGLAKTFELDGEIRIIPGTLGQPANILLNGNVAGLDDHITDKDVISCSEARDGEDGRARIMDFIGLRTSKKVILNDQAVPLGPAIYMNDQLADLETEIVDLAKITIKPEMTLRELLKQRCRLDQAEERNIVVTIDGEPRIITQQSFHLYVNGQEASLDAHLKDTDIISYDTNASRHYKIKEVVPAPPAGHGVQLRINGQEYNIEGQRGKYFMNGQEVSADEFLISGADIRTAPGKDAELIMVDLLRYVPLNVEQNPGKKLKMLINGRAASFTTGLSQGAEVQLFFE